MKDINLHNFDLIVINSSAGKDSLAAMWEISRLAGLQAYPKDRIHVSHQDLGDAEWEGTGELAQQQAELFGWEFHVISRVQADGSGDTILEYAERRGMFPSSQQRWCTSDFKRDPGAKVVRALAKPFMDNDDPAQVLHVFGFRAEESPARSKKEEFVLNKRLSCKSREVWDFLPIHDWSTQKVWDVIKSNDLPYHRAYDLGMPRLSCAFCIFAPFDALVVAGKANPELLDKYVETEAKIGHDFQEGKPIADVKAAIEDGYEPEVIMNWHM